jgi:hypothetical protein
VSIREVLTVKKTAYSPEQIVVKMREIETIAVTEDVGIAVAAKRLLPLAQEVCRDAQG